MPLMSGVFRPSLAPAALKSTAAAGSASKRAMPAVLAREKKQKHATRSSESEGGGAGAVTATSLQSVALKSIAAAAAVGLCVSLAVPAVAVAGASSVFVGEFADPKHPGCRRTIQGSGAVLDVLGTDGTPGCANGERQRPWSLKGDIVKVPSKQDEILIDFSPKGGPKNLLGKWTGTGILFPDGNEWKKLD